MQKVFRTNKTKLQSCISTIKCLGTLKGSGWSDNRHYLSHKCVECFVHWGESLEVVKEQPRSLQVTGGKLQNADGGKADADPWVTRVLSPGHLVNKPDQGGEEAVQLPGHTGGTQPRDGG